jgi:ribonucleoside-diphosphate reductase alpha chain
MTVQEWLGTDNQLGIDIWEKKYRYENETFDEWLNRVSGGNEAIKQLIKERKFLFGGRILSNRGLNKYGIKTTLSNCYVVEPPEDNIESIFECAKKLARTYSYGGGCGVDISKLAPTGAKIRNTAKETTGAVSFMDLYGMITGLIGQNGRRGALMISIACDHPDVERFIELKSDLNKVTKANISVRITDKFMQAVRDDGDFVLTFTREETGEVIERVVKARELFRKMCEMNWDYAEPGMLFWDRIESWNLLSEDDSFHYAGTNPCAEEPLPAGGSCLLGSLNLAEFVTDDGTFDISSFNMAVDTAVRALNEVLDEGLPLHPLQEQKDSVRDWRQIGLGIFGLADMLIKLGIRYGSEWAVDLCNQIGFEMANQAILTSAKLAMDKGTYPCYSAEHVLESRYFNVNTDQHTRNMVKNMVCTTLSF